MKLEGGWIKFNERPNFEAELKKKEKKEGVEKGELPIWMNCELKFDSKRDEEMEIEWLAFITTLLH